MASRGHAKIKLGFVLAEKKFFLPMMSFLADVTDGRYFD